MENDAKRMPCPGAQARNAVAHIHPVRAARSRDRTMMNRENHCVTLHQRHDLGAGLHTRALFSQDKFTTSEIGFRIA
jgi:hypothetical protein